MSDAERCREAREHLISAIVQYRQALHLLPGTQWPKATGNDRVALRIMYSLLAFLEVQPGVRGLARVQRQWRAGDYYTITEIREADWPV